VVVASFIIGLPEAELLLPRNDETMLNISCWRITNNETPKYPKSSTPKNGKI